MNKTFINTLIAGAITAGVVYFVFKTMKTTPSILSEKIRKKIFG